MKKPERSYFLVKRSRPNLSKKPQKLNLVVIGNAFAAFSVFYEDENFCDMFSEDCLIIIIRPLTCINAISIST